MTMTDTAPIERTWPTVLVADWLGVSHPTINRWLYRLRSPHPGSGHRIRLDRHEVLTFHAWAQLDAAVTGSTVQLRMLVAETLRRRPAPYVVILGPGRAASCDDWDTAVTLVCELGHGAMRWLIDVSPAWEATT